jgi:hypothetical protein
MTLDRTPAVGDWKVTVTKEGQMLDVPRYRVAMCHRWTSGGGPGVWRSPAADNAEFSEIYVCGSVWHCPICAPKITTGRRNELVAAIGAWRDRGGEVYLATRTFSHDKHSRELRELMAELVHALARAKGARGAKELSARAGAVGSIRSLEVTHGEMNGWHPHTHELIFARPGERARLLSHRVAWIRLLVKMGMAGMREGMSRAERAEQFRFLRRHAYTVQLGDKAADYVAKFGMEPATEEGGRWGPASELVRGHQKTGERLSGRTPFELLRRYVDAGDRRSGMLFRDFAIAFQGRAQLFWSKGLRAALVELCEGVSAEIYYVAGATDEQLAWAARARCIGRALSDDDLAATRAPDCTEFAYRFNPAEWRLVLSRDARHDVLMAAQVDGGAGVRALLERLRGERATHGDSYLDDFRRLDAGAGWRHVFGPNPREM